MEHLRQAWGKLVTSSEERPRPRFPVPGAASDLLEHMRVVHGMPVSSYEHRNVKADVVHQWHTDAHGKGMPGSNHDHSGKLRQTGWAQDPDNPEKSKNGGYYSPPKPGDDQQIYRFLDRFDL